MHMMEDRSRAKERRHRIQFITWEYCVVGKKCDQGTLNINGKEMEEVESFKYLGVWFDQWMRGNVHLMKMVEKAEEWVGKVEWMARVNGDMAVERGRMAYRS